MAAIPRSERHGAYAVPQRFGISAILALTTLFAGVFAILKGFESPPVVYLFFGTLGVTICLAQMFFGRVPRVSSIIAGAILLPFWVFVTAIFFDPPTRITTQIALYVVREALVVAPIMIVAGAFLGYLTGTVMAGFFLLLDLAQAPRGASHALPPEDEPRPAAEVVEPPV